MIRKQRRTCDSEREWSARIWQRSVSLTVAEEATAVGFEGTDAVI